MENEKEESLNKGFEEYINSLKKLYEQSSLKEKHRLNEHIKHLIKTHGEHDLNFIKNDLK